MFVAGLDMTHVFSIHAIREKRYKLFILLVKSHVPFTLGIKTTFRKVIKEIFRILCYQYLKSEIG